MLKPPLEADLRTFGHEVVRQQKGWSVDALAERTRVRMNTAINVESARKGLRLSTVHALAQALGVPLSYLVRVFDAR